MQTYKNTTNDPVVIPNVGAVPPQGTIDTELNLNTPDLKLITNHQPAAPTPTPPTPSVPEPQPVQAAPEPPQEGEN